MRTCLTSRQRMVVIALYTRHDWSCPQIAEMAGVGRRAIENALHRAGVELTHRGRWRRQPTPGIPAARSWFAEAGRAARAACADERPAVKDGAFRRRRCPACERLTEYAHACPACGHDFNERHDDP